MRNELSERLRKALGRLDDRQRETLTLRYFDDLEHQSRALFPLAEFTDKRRVFSRFR
jgi:DNA-directed RNA polymerase sigma subunit (sigma70/sigma32)